jgi:hypothetical protein
LVFWATLKSMKLTHFKGLGAYRTSPVPPGNPCWIQGLIITTIPQVVRKKQEQSLKNWILSPNDQTWPNKKTGCILKFWPNRAVDQQPIFSVAVDIFLSPSHGGLSVIAETLVILDVTMILTSF